MAVDCIPEFPRARERRQGPSRGSTDVQSGIGRIWRNRNPPSAPRRVMASLIRPTGKPPGRPMSAFFTRSHLCPIQIGKSANGRLQWAEGQRAEEQRAAKRTGEKRDGPCVANRSSTSSVMVQAFVVHVRVARDRRHHHDAVQDGMARCWGSRRNGGDGWWKARSRRWSGRPRGRQRVQTREADGHRRRDRSAGSRGGVEGNGRHRAAPGLGPVCSMSSIPMRCGRRG